MFVNFKKLRFKNILSYGNQFTELNLSKGLNLIKAQNGSGKSTILDALNFCLFGKPFRNIKMNQLVNKYNEKDLVVSVEFSIGNDEYEIIRGLKPNIFELKKNGNDLNSLSSKKLNQEEIDKILGINERLFKNIVSFAVTINKPFLSMSIGDKRALIESIFNIDVLSDMGKEVKKRYTINKTEQKIKLNEMTSYQNSINDNKNYITKISEYIEKFDENKKIQIDSLKNDVIRIKEEIEKHNKNINIGNESIKKISNDITLPDEEEITKVNKDLGIAEHEKNNIEKTLKTIGSAKVCPLCNSELDEGHALEHINQLKNNLKNIVENIIPSLREKEKILNEQKNNALSINKKINIIKEKVNQEIFTAKNKMNSIESLVKQINDINNKECDLSTTEYEEKLIELNKQLEEINKIISDLNEKNIIDEKLIDILGDDGLRMYFFNKLLPILNQRINHYLNRFELNVNIEFDCYMNETITTGKFNQEYNQFSGGERSRIDMAILLSFFDVSKIISNWSCSFLAIDEILDSGVDSNGIEQFLSTLYNIVSEDNKNLGIYIISHKLADIQVNWNEIIEIQKKSLFSEIKVK